MLRGSRGFYEHPNPYIAFSQDLDRLAYRLFQAGIVDFGEFAFKHHATDPDAARSPFKFNIRTPDNPGNPGKLDNELLYQIAAAMCACSNGQVTIYDSPYFCRYVAGVPHAGDPLATAILNCSYDRIKRARQLHLAKIGSGANRHIGTLQEIDIIAGSWVLLVDDLVTKAGSKLEAIAALEAAGLRIRHLLFFIDREEGGAELLEQAGYTVHTVFKARPLLWFGRVNGFISQEQYAAGCEYIAQSRWKTLGMHL